MIDKDNMVEVIMVKEEVAKDNETPFIDPISPNCINWVKHIKRRES